MTSQTYSLSELPAGSSWIYRLDANDAITQCQILNLTPASTLAENRKILSDYLSTLAFNSGSETILLNHNTSSDDSLQQAQNNPPPPVTTSATENPTIPATSKAFSTETITTTTPIATTAVAATLHPAMAPHTTNAPTSLFPQQPIWSLGDNKPGPLFSAPSTSSQTLPFPQPSWTDLVQATAVAVGKQVAAAMAEFRSPGGSGGARMGVLPDLIRGCPWLQELIPKTN